MEMQSVQIKENSKIRRESKRQLKGKWGMALLLSLVSSIIPIIIFEALTYAPNYILYLGQIIVALCISAPLALGLVGCFLKLIRGEKFIFKDLFNGFNKFTSAALLQFFISLFVFLWTLLFIVPGMIAGYRYAMSYYILSDNSEIGAKEALNRSKKMMAGHKMKLFCLHLSFIGWAILAIITLGIGFLWLIPYVRTATTNFYENLKEQNK